MRLATALGATALSAWLYGLAFPPLSLRPLAFVALVPLLLGLRAVGWRGALLIGFLWPQLASLGVAEALPGAVEGYFLQPRWLAWAFAIGVWALTGSLYYMAFALAHRALLARRPPALALLVAAAWVALELGRGRLLTGTSFFIGNPWALIGYSQVGSDALMQVASLGGIYAVGFVVVASNAAIALAIEQLRTGGALRGTGLGLAAQGAAPLAAALLFGLASLPPARGALAPSAVPPARASVAAAGTGAAALAAPPLRVVVVQGHLDSGTRWDPAFHGQHLDTYLGLTQRGTAAAQPDVVVWPESSFTFHLEREPALRRRIAHVLSPTGTQLIAGGPSGTDAVPPRYFNSVHLIDPDGEPRARYDKRYLVPFAEYVPLSMIDLVRRRFGRVRSFTPGSRTEPLPVRTGAAGVLVCNEAMLPEVARQRVLDGAQWLVNPSNDTWIAEPKWARLMFDLVSVRAIEQRRTLVRASTSGPSGIVDAWGRVQIRTEPGQRAVIAGVVEPRSALSPYARWGDAFAFACTAIVGLAIAVRRPPRAVVPAAAGAARERAERDAPAHGTPAPAAGAPADGPGRRHTP